MEETNEKKCTKERKKERKSYKVYEIFVPLNPIIRGLGSNAYLPFAVSLGCWPFYI
jgi:hypothetical protein